MTQSRQCKTLPHNTPVTQAGTTQDDVTVLHLPATFYPEGRKYRLKSEGNGLSATAIKPPTRPMTGTVHLAINGTDNTVNLHESWITPCGLPLRGDEKRCASWFISDLGDASEGSVSPNVVVCGDYKEVREGRMVADWSFESFRSKEDKRPVRLLR